MGISFLVFDMKSKGRHVRPIQTIDAATRFNEVFFTRVRRSGEPVGEENKAGLRKSSCSERNATGASPGVGVSKERLRRIKERLQGRSGGKTVLEDPRVSEKSSRPARSS